MTTQHIIPPAQIESQLLKIWEGLAKENKMRACLFNLIVFNKLSGRTDYFRNIVQKVLEKYPCRVIFISSDPDSSQNYLKTAVSVVTPPNGSDLIACDYIDIGVAGPLLARVPFVLLPHIIPDLPVSLLWAEDCSEPHPLFEPLSKLANRIIFDSESAESLLAFSQKVLKIKKETNLDIADLNWARIEGWRELVFSTFSPKDLQGHLQEISKVEISYNSQETEFFCHLKIQAMYLLAWISSRLGWKFKRASKNLHFDFDQTEAQIYSAIWQKLGPGTVISINIETKSGYSFHCARIPKEYHRVSIQIASKEKCELPYQFVLGQTATGQSLVKEIITQGTSAHYLEMLETLNSLDRDQLC
ncbi:MAG: hypothetical protein A3E80_05420 [Chlamydiae bacterium RIFCSPHIGHO2_12_FULL_49_9]|nr:MAG: hypothetical protein A3E80_05420 [Chlamydiae bacterium RIFCSPHIGHO2_12_FULL_49_9]